MKTLYSFEVENDGKKYELMIAKPTRRQIEEAEVEYAAEYSRCVRRGILPKSILTNKYEESGGLMPKDQAKKLNGKYSEFNDLTAEITRLKSGSSSSKANKAKLSKLEERYTELRREISDIESSNSAAFQNSADSIAQNKALVWYAVNLTMIKNDKNQWEPYFKGDDFEEKEDSYYEKEDSEDMVYFKSIGIIGSVISIWQFNKSFSEKEIEDVLTEYEIIKKEEKEKDKKEEKEDKKDVDEQ